MAGAPLIIGVLVVTTTVAVGVGSAGAASVHAVRLAAVTDAAALAAADTLLGLATGLPCERAAEIARRSGFRLDACTTEEATVIVTLTAEVGPFTAHARARAGPSALASR